MICKLIGILNLKINCFNKKKKKNRVVKQCQGIPGNDLF